MNSTKEIIEAPILHHEPLTADVWRLDVLAPNLAKQAQPGQFAMLRKKHGTHFLRRPLGIAFVDIVKGKVSFIYRLLGGGTHELATLRVGETVNVEAPLGSQTFSLETGRSLLVGGGAGAAPLLFLAKVLAEKYKKPIILLGGRNAAETFWAELLAPYAEKIYLATDDGSKGFHGFVTGLLPKVWAQHAFSHIQTCGPTPMMFGVAKFAKAKGIPCEVSLEARMACGFGVCLGCSFTGENSGKRRRVCADGPVFPAEEVFACTID